PSGVLVVLAFEMLRAMTSRKRCCVLIPLELMSSGRSICRSGRGNSGNETGSAIAAHRSAEVVVRLAQQSCFRLEAELGVGELSHVALEIGLSGLRARQLAGEIGAAAGVARARDAGGDRSMRGARFFETAAQHGGDRIGTEQASEHFSSGQGD